MHPIHARQSRKEEQGRQCRQGRPASFSAFSRKTWIRVRLGGLDSGRSVKVTSAGFMPSQIQQKQSKNGHTQLVLRQKHLPLLPHLGGFGSKGIPELDVISFAVLEVGAAFLNIKNLSRAMSAFRVRSLRIVKEKTWKPSSSCAMELLHTLSTSPWEHSHQASRWSGSHRPASDAVPQQASTCHLTSSAYALVAAWWQQSQMHTASK